MGCRGCRGSGCCRSGPSAPQLQSDVAATTASNWAITGAGGNDLEDIVANSIGALIGLGGVLIVMNLTGGQLRELSRTRRLQLITAAGAANVLAVASWFVGAERRQHSVRSTVTERFRNKDLNTLQDELGPRSGRVSRSSGPGLDAADGQAMR